MGLAASFPGFSAPSWLRARSACPPAQASFAHSPAPHTQRATPGSTSSEGLLSTGPARLTVSPDGGGSTLVYLPPACLRLATVA